MGQFSFPCANCGCSGPCPCATEAAELGVYYPQFFVNLPTVGSCGPFALPGDYFPLQTVNIGGNCIWSYSIGTVGDYGIAAIMQHGVIAGCPAGESESGWLLNFASGNVVPNVRYWYPDPNQVFGGAAFFIPAQFLAGGPWTFTLCNNGNASGCTGAFPWGMPATLEVFADSVGTPCTNCTDCATTILPATMHVTLTSPNGACNCLIGTYALTWNQATNVWQAVIPGTCGTQTMTLSFGCFDTFPGVQYTFVVQCATGQVLQQRASIACSPFAAVFDIALQGLGCAPCSGGVGFGLHAVVTL
jgi:hypothetical protein